MSPFRLIKTRLRRALRDEEGAVTVDWVVLTALVVGFAAVVISVLADPINNVGTVIADRIEQAP